MMFKLRKFLLISIPGMCIITLGMAVHLANAQTPSPVPNIISPEINVSPRAQTV